MLNAIFYLLRKGCQCRVLPQEFGLKRCIDDRELLEQEMKDIVARDGRALRFSSVEQAKL